MSRQVEFPPMPASGRCRVSIVIKALNEERRIVAAVESALRAVAAVGGEVILADSGSTDRTVELAAGYPVRIVQLADPRERCCGIGPQLGYQYARGDYVYILDGDMEMLPGFLEQAVAYMDSHGDVAGVGGLVMEQNRESLEYLARMERAAAHMQPGEVDRLDMGGLYRRRAVDAAGHFSNRNLHSYEEVDLAVRLRALGWRLWRLPLAAVNHYGHDAPPYQLLLRRWRTGYICGLGELLRAALGRPHLSLVLRDVRELRLYGLVLGWWVVLVLLPFLPLAPAVRLAAFGGLLLAPFLVMAWRKRSLAKALFSVVSWCFNTAGLVRGFLQSQCPAERRIAGNVLHG